MDIQKLKVLIEKNPFIAYPLIAVIALAGWSLLLMAVSPNTKDKGQSSLSSEKNTSIGLSVGGVDQQAYIARLEKNYYDFQERVKGVEDDIKKINKTLKSLDQKLMVKFEERFSELQQGVGNDSNSTQAMELAVAAINPLEQDSGDFVYLPIGSFCKGTLLTGVYAAADANNPLPVLIALDEAFYGPNKTRIPLKGAFLLGKAVGDIVSQRALVQISALSLVLPNGQTFEREDNLGYLTDQSGDLGIRGQIIRNTGKALALSFMGGFMSGGAQAVADGEVTTSETQLGGMRRDVTGDVSKRAVFAGLATSAGRLSDYYAKQADNLIPAVYVPTGETVYFIVQKGVRINGLPRVDIAHISSIN